MDRSNTEHSPGVAQATSVGRKKCYFIRLFSESKDREEQTLQPPMSIRLQQDYPTPSPTVLLTDHSLPTPE